MPFSVQLHEDFQSEFRELPQMVQDQIVAASVVLRQAGPMLGRPLVGTLRQSEYPNMKELRLTVPDGEWRVAFAFDPKREAILLVAASKSGRPESRFYEALIRVADARFSEHIRRLKSKKRKD